MVIAPPEARPLLKTVSELMTREVDPLRPVDALLSAAGARQERGSHEFERIKELQEALEAEKANLARAQAQLAAEIEKAAAAEAKAASIAADAECYAAVARRYQSKAERAKQRADIAEDRVKAIQEASGLRGLAMRVLSGV